MSAGAVLPLTEKEKTAVGLGPQFHPAFYIASWIFFSNLTILFNKWLIDTAGFRYPVILTCWHLVFATLATQFLAKTTRLLDSRHSVKMTSSLYLRAVVPIGLLYSGSLVCSNLVYLYLSVAFIQMLKAAAPVAVLFVSWLWGVSNPDGRTLGNILIIVCGVALASAGEIEFSWLGFLFQLGGIIFEAVRLVMIQVMLSDDGQKMDPLVSLYYYAPVCAVMNLLVALATEWSVFRWEDVQRTGIDMLVLNALVAFLLNVSSVFLIGKTSGLVMTLTGILKNILLVIASVLIWHTSVTSIQFLGYSVALFGMLIYSLGWQQLRATAKNTTVWAKTQWATGGTSLDGSGLSPLMRRTLFLAVLVILTLTIGVGFFSDGTEEAVVDGVGVTRVIRNENTGWLSYFGLGSST